MVDSTDDVIRQAGSVSQSSIETSATNAPSETLIASVKEAFGKELLQLESNHGDLIIRVTKAGYAKAAKITNEELDCDFLSFVSAIDFMPMPVNEDDFNREAAQPTQPKEQLMFVMILTTLRILVSHLLLMYFLEQIGTNVKHGKCTV